MPWTPASLRDALRRHGVRPRRSLGQSFLIDGNFLDALARDIAFDAQTDVIEIGTGPGNLTERLALRARHVWSFDVDGAILRVARELLAGWPNVTLAEADGAEFESRVPAGSYVMVSNLPYSDYRRLLTAMLGTRLPVRAWYLMLQRDVFDRLAAPVGSPRYGPLSVVVQGLFELRLLRKAGPALLHPRPRIESAFFRLTRRRAVPEAGLEKTWKRLEALFRGKRKKLGSAARAAGLALDPGLAGRRVQMLEPDALLDLLSGERR